MALCYAKGRGMQWKIGPLRGKWHFAVHVLGDQVILSCNFNSNLRLLYIASQGPAPGNAPPREPLQSVCVPTCSTKGTNTKMGSRCPGNAGEGDNRMVQVINSSVIG